MAIQGVTGQNYYEKLRGNARTQQKKTTSDFLENMSEKTDRLPQEADTDHAVNPYTYVRTDRYSNSLQTKIMVQDNGRLQMDAVMECEARHIRYEETDYSKTYVASGFTFKAQISVDAHQVYIEKKSEDGSVTGYEVDPLRIPQDTEDPLEQMALEAWEMARRGLAGEEPFFEEIDPQELQKELMGEKTEEKEDDMMSLTLQEAMQKFYDYVKDRIENGDPEFPIGGASMSIREWEKMLEKVDENLDELRKAMREEQEKREEKDEQVVKAVTEEQIARLLEEREEKETI